MLLLSNLKISYEFEVMKISCYVFFYWFITLAFMFRALIHFELISVICSELELKVQLHSIACVWKKANYYGIILCTDLISDKISRALNGLNASSTPCSVLIDKLHFPNNPPYQTDQVKLLFTPEQ